MKLIKILKRYLEIFSLNDNILRYIGGSEALPSPYTAEEEANLTKMLKDNESVKEDLIEHIHCLSQYIIVMEMNLC